MKYKILLIILVASILLLSGCDVAKKWFKKIPSKLPGLGDEEQTTFGGTGSISPVIVEPWEDSDKGYGSVPQGHPFSPVVTIINYGGAESEGQTCITGPDRDIFSGFPGCECQGFQQIRTEELGFEPVDLEFGPYSITKENPDDTEYGLTAVTRYKYGTIITAKVVIEKEAKSEEAEIISVTSGPIEIDSIDSRIIPRGDNHVTMVFNIYVEDEGDGNLWDIERLNERCEPPKSMPVDKDEKKIRAEIVSFPVSADTICGEISLDEDGEGIITCEAKDISLYDSRDNYLFDDYEPEIIFELEYAYETRSSTKFRIQ